MWSCVYGIHMDNKEIPTAYYSLSHTLSISLLLYQFRPFIPNLLIDWKTSQVLWMHAHFATNNTIHISLEWLSEHTSLSILVYWKFNFSLILFLCVIVWLPVIQIQLLLISLFCAYTLFTDPSNEKCDESEQNRDICWYFWVCDI